MIKLLKKIATQLELLGMPEQASRIDSILPVVNEYLYSDVDLLQKHFGERGLKKAWRDEHIYKTSSIKAIERKKEEYLRDLEQKTSQ